MPSCSWTRPWASPSAFTTIAPIPAGERTRPAPDSTTWPSGRPPLRPGCVGGAARRARSGPLRCHRRDQPHPLLHGRLPRPRQHSTGVRLRRDVTVIVPGNTHRPSVPSRPGLLGAVGVEVLEGFALLPGERAPGARGGVSMISKWRPPSRRSWTRRARVGATTTSSIPRRAASPAMAGSTHSPSSLLVGDLGEVEHDGVGSLVQDGGDGPAQHGRGGTAHAAHQADDGDVPVALDGPVQGVHCGSRSRPTLRLRRGNSPGGHRRSVPSWCS